MRTLGGGASRFVTSVDAIRWLDDASLGLLSTLLAGKLAVVLATVRAHEPLPEAVAAVERSCAIRRIAVGRLGRTEVDQCIGAALPGAVDGIFAHDLYLASRGNPLFLNEVISGGLANGTIKQVSGMWTIEGRLAPTPRLTAMFDSELHAITETERHVLALLAICEPLDVRAIEQLGLGEAVTELDRLGCVDAVEDGQRLMVRTVQPLLAALLRTRLSPLRRRALLREAVAVLAPLAAPHDQLRLALWKLDAGHEVAAGELLAAAHQARLDHDFVAVERLATAALHTATTCDALLLQAEASQILGRAESVEAALAAAQELATEDRSKLAVALVRQRRLLWSGVDPAPAAAVVEAAHQQLNHPVSRDLVLAALAMTHAITGLPRDCLDAIDRMESGSDVAAAAVVLPRAIATMRAGRPELAADMASVRIQAPRSIAPTDVGHPATAWLAAGMALTECGRFAEAERALRDAYHHAVERRIVQMQVWLAHGLGRNALSRGAFHQADRWFTEGRAVSEITGFGPGRHAALTGLIVAAGQLVDYRRVTSLAEEAGSIGRSDHGNRWPHGSLAEAWICVASGCGDEAVGVVRAAAEAAREGGELLLLDELLYEALRFGAAPEQIAPMVPETAAVEGELAAARQAFVGGVCDADVVALEESERRFTALDVPLAAAEAAVQLSRLCHRLGRTRQASAAAAGSTHHHAAAGGVRSLLLAEPVNGVALSSREREIARLAADGLASKEIAVRLGLSVRTVSNHLQNAYTKLGVSSRERLTEVLLG